MPTIQNVSYSDIESNYTTFYVNHGTDSMLIQIVDPDMDFPVPYHKFQKTYQYKFLDVEETDGIDTSLLINDSIASSIVRNLYEALEHDMNVVVHCFAGVARSGAVVEAAIQIGFSDPFTYRHPNRVILDLLLKHI